MPRPRFTVPCLMLAVAVAGVILGMLAERRARFRGLADSHTYYAGIRRAASRKHTKMTRDNFAAESARTKKALAWSKWHEIQSAKYDRAARYPWLPIAPDPPEPE